MALTGSARASRISASFRVSVLGSPSNWSRPLTSMVRVSSEGKADPSVHFTSSAEASEINTLYFSRMYLMTASSISSPAMRMESENTLPL